MNSCRIEMQVTVDLLNPNYVIALIIARYYSRQLRCRGMSLVDVFVHAHMQDNSQCSSWILTELDMLYKLVTSVTSYFLMCYAYTCTSYARHFFVLSTVDKNVFSVSEQGLTSPPTQYRLSKRLSASANNSVKKATIYLQKPPYWSLML